MIPKYRAWSKQYQMMFEVAGIYFWGETYTITCNSLDDDFEFEEKEIELMQWTGLKDVLGKEVYEGDVIFTRHLAHSWKGSMFIKQNIQAGRWELAPASNCLKNVRIFSEFNVYEQKLEVVGNIYENPEMLNDTKV